jgi:diguanylate cyclase (GGDEF)-like protein
MTPVGSVNRLPEVPRPGDAQGFGAVGCCREFGEGFQTVCRRVQTVRKVGESDKRRLVGRAGRAGERLRLVVRLPAWLRVALLAETEAVRRVTATALYVLFIPLAFLVEVGYSGLSDHPAVIGVATLGLACQAGLTWLVRPMPLRGWALLTVAVAASFVAYAYASREAGEALTVVLLIPVGWVAIFLPGRLVMLSAATNTMVFGWVALSEETAARWLVFTVRSLTLLVLASALHFLVAALRRAQHQAERRASLDSVTGLVSRPRMLDILDALHFGGDRQATLVVLDLDHFKQVNDVHGHLAGDQALRDVANVLRSVTREEDVLARWGGEEFLALLPRVPEHDIYAAADKLRAAIGDHTFRIEGAAVRLTASAGATPIRVGASIRALIAAADDALYQAKRRGRNQTMIGRPRVDQMTVTGSHELGAVRRIVEQAAKGAQLTPEQTLDAVIGVSEACLRLRPQGGRPVELAVTIHDRTETFTVIVEDRAARGTTRRDDELNATVLRQVGNEVRVDERDSLREVRIVFTKSEPTGAYADAAGPRFTTAADVRRA